MNPNVGIQEVCNNDIRNQVNSFSIIGMFLFLVLIIMPEDVMAYEFNAGFGLGSSTLTESHDFDDGSLGIANTDDKNLATTVYGEMEFNRYVRLELGILDGGLSTVKTSSGGGYFWVSGPVDVEYGIFGVKLGAVGTIPLTPNNNFKLLFKGGLMHWVSVVTLSDVCCEVDDNDTGIAPYFGVGLEIDLTRLLAVRLQHEQFSVDAHSDYFLYDYDFDYSNVTAGVVFRF